MKFFLSACLCGPPGGSLARPTVCNLYSVTKGQQPIRDLFAVKHDRAGNLPPLPGIFPDHAAPIVRVADDGERELVMARGGLGQDQEFRGSA